MLGTVLGIKYTSLNKTVFPLVEFIFQWREMDSNNTVTQRFAQSCLTPCNPTDCSLPGSSVNGILQGRILEWVAIPFSRASSQPRERTWASYIAGRFFTV